MAGVKLCQVFLLMVALYFSSVDACGGITHIEISYRALNNYEDILNHTNYDTIIRQNQDALEAGSSYPDSFYSDVCFDGLYHNISEDTHWTPFINATVNYIRKHYPKPWTMHDQKLIAFLMGVVSHSVADISWHSLGIPQGFLSTMARTNYHNDYPTAHSDGDLGGDVMNLFQLNLTYSDMVGEWWIPTTDLKNIYRDMYGRDKINETVIEACGQLMYLAKLAEKLAVKKYFPISARKSPFLLDNLYDYFLGGIEDMAVWTRRIWKHVSYTIEHGQGDCDMPRNPLYIRCDKARGVGAQTAGKGSANGRTLYKRPNLMGSRLSDIIVKRHGRGISLKPGPRLLKKIRKVEQKFKSLHFESEKQKIPIPQPNRNRRYPDAVFSISSKYSKLGSAFAVGDLDKDGNDDIVIGAPGIYSSSGQQNGMVFIIYGTDYGLNVSQLDIYKAADIRIPGPENEHSAHTQFGSSLAIFDFDKDGKLDIAIGAPSYGSENLTYVGKVYIFSVLGKNKFSLRGEVTCKDIYCTLGSTLATGDINSDLYHDLIVASAYAPGGGNQRGLVGVVKADKRYQGKHGMQIPIMSFEDVMTGSHNYSWYGKSVDVKSFGDDTYLAVGEPNFRKCALSNCSYDSGDTQAVGKVRMYKSQGALVKPYRSFEGRRQFEMMGGAVAMGRPYDQYTNIVAVAKTGNSVRGHIEHIPIEFFQVGSVYLYNISNFVQYPMAVFNGNRRYGRFGATLKFADLNRDGHDDFIIGSPLRTKDVTEEFYGGEQGGVYVFLGGSDFPKGDATGNCGLFHAVEPCPSKKATYELVMDEQFARFGSQLAVVKSKTKINLLVTASHSSVGARLSGAIAVFNF